MAFLLAIVFAFATGNDKPVKEDTLIDGYIGMVGNCSKVQVNCTTTDGPVCKYTSGQTVHRDLGCSTFLYEWTQ